MAKNINQLSLTSIVLYPLASLVTIVLLSLLIAYILFNVLSSTGIFRFGGAIGEFGEFGGAAASFYASMLFLKRWYNQMVDRIVIKEGRTNRKLHIKGLDHEYEYRCKYWLFYAETAKEKEFTPNYRWEAGYLTLDIKDVSPADMIMIRIENSQNVWVYDYFYSCISVIDVRNMIIKTK